MNDRGNRTVICSVALLDIVDYSRRVGQEQLALKERFNALIGEVVKDIAPNDRVLIDRGDGAALCFMGDPEDALFVGMNLRDRLRTPENEVIGLAVRIGINLGPVRMIHDINNQQNVIGDGINVAQRVMNFAEPNQIMVSRTYYEVVSPLSQEFTRLFLYAGAHTDKHVRKHEIYEVGPGVDEPAMARAKAQPVSGNSATSTRAVIGAFRGFVDTTLPGAATARAATSKPTAPAQKRNYTLIIGAAATAVIAVGITVFAATKMESDKANVTGQTEAPTTVTNQAASPVVALVTTAKNNVEAKAPVSAAMPKSEVRPAVSAWAPRSNAEAKMPLPLARSRAESKVPAPVVKPNVEAKIAGMKAKAPELKPANAAPRVAAVNPVQTEVMKTDARKDSVAKASSKDNVPEASNNAIGKLVFWIAPWGEIFIDGKQIGSSPPLKVYELQAGSHRVEIYNESAGFPYKETVEVTAGAIKHVNVTFRQ